MITYSKSSIAECYNKLSAATSTADANLASLRKLMNSPDCIPNNRSLSKTIEEIADYKEALSIHEKVLNILQKNWKNTHCKLLNDISDTKFIQDINNEITTSVKSQITILGECFTYEEPHRLDAMDVYNYLMDMHEILHRIIPYIIKVAEKDIPLYFEIYQFILQYEEAHYKLLNYEDELVRLSNLHANSSAVTPCLYSFGMATYICTMESQNTLRNAYRTYLRRKVKPVKITNKSTKTQQEYSHEV